MWTMRPRVLTTRYLAAALLLFAGGWSAGRAGTSFSEDGPGWRTIPKESRLSYVDGYNTGYRDGSVENSFEWSARLLAAVISKHITGDQSLAITRQEVPRGDSWTDKMSWTGWTATKVTGLEIEEGMEKFYANPANQAICWRDAFGIVSRSIAGQTFSKADMGAIRGAAAKHGCE